jgi:predicted aconitase with swiveling domain
MRSDDLVPLLKPPRGVPSGPAVGFRQGVIISWDTETAENTVLVAGAVMENLPILNTSEAALLAAGDVVGILTAGPTWAIMGRFTYPGTPEAVSSIKAITNRIVAAKNGEGGTRNSTVFGDLAGTAVGPAVTTTIGPSGRALVLWGAEMGGTGAYMVKNTPHVGVELSGANVQLADKFVALNFNLEHPETGTAIFDALSVFWTQNSTFHLYTGLSPGETTFTLKYCHDGLNPSANMNFNSREIAVFTL